jgi:type VI protein secretion system component Hcp
MTFNGLKYVLGLLLALQFGPQCFAQQNIFVQFDTSAFICTGAGNKEASGFSAVSSVGFGATDTVTHSVGGDFPGKPMFPDIKLAKTLDDCTPDILNSLARGKIFNTVKIEILKTTPTGMVIHALDILLKRVIITSDAFTDDASGQPSEVITLDWTQISVTEGTKVFTWNRATNTP